MVSLRGVCFSFKALLLLGGPGSWVLAPKFSRPTGEPSDPPVRFDSTGQAFRARRRGERLRNSKRLRLRRLMRVFVNQPRGLYQVPESSSRPVVPRRRHGRSVRSQAKPAALAAEPPQVHIPRIKETPRVKGKVQGRRQKREMGRMPKIRTPRFKRLRSKESACFTRKPSASETPARSRPQHLKPRLKPRPNHMLRHPQVLVRPRLLLRLSWPCLGIRSLRPCSSRITVDVVADTGAGEHFGPKSALLHQVVPESLVDRYVGSSRRQAEARKALMKR